MHVEILVEETSAEASLQMLLPKLLPTDATFRIHPYQGKMDLLSKLPSRLKGYANWSKGRDDFWIVVLIDKDREDCNKLKQKLDAAADAAGLVTKSKARAGARFHVVNRIAVEELEAWFLGDPPAILQAYPRVPASFHRRERFRDPDGIKGGTAEALEKLLQDAGYYTAGLQKTRAAREIARHMEPSLNHSRSFQAFREGLAAMSKTPRGR